MVPRGNGGNADAAGEEEKEEEAENKGDGAPPPRCVSPVPCAPREACAAAAQPAAVWRRTAYRRAVFWSGRLTFIITRRSFVNKPLAKASAVRTVDTDVDANAAEDTDAGNAPVQKDDSLVVALSPLSAAQLTVRCV